jgi:WXG100 family type VII secretion target
VTRGPSGAERIENWLGPAGAAYHIIKPIVDFLAHPLDSVTGDPDGLNDKAQAWRNAATKMNQLADDELTARTDLLSYWGGQAADAFNTEMTEVNQSLRDIAGHFVGTAELLEGSAEGARQAQDLVEQIIRELIAWLIVTIIVALASSWITLGASVAAGSAAGAAEAAVTAGRCATVAARLAKLLRTAESFLKKMSEFAKAYKLTKIRGVGVRNWTSARFATSNGAQLIATNWVIKQTIVKPTLGPTIDRVTGADRSWELPQVL